MRPILAALVVFLLAGTPAPAGSTDDSRYLAAHRAAVKQRARADDLQRRLTVRVRQVRRLERRLASGDVTPVVAIRLVFGRYAEQAIRVSSCETGGSFSVYASNHGVYLGLFQMGPYARARYGHSHTALGQAQAAYRYFVDSGKTWGPWSCKP